MSKDTRLKNIANLCAALCAAGIPAEVDWDAQWYCSDNKTHYGIQISFDSGSYDEECFCFTPDGIPISNCVKAPIKKR